jgi:hypothetical protein
MDGSKELDLRSAIREVLVIGIVKIVLAIAVFALSTVIVETAKAYYFRANSWLNDGSQAVSREVVDLYRR